MPKEKAPEREQEDYRLSIRLSETLETKIKREAIERGTNINQTMLYILNKLIDSI